MAEEDQGMEEIWAYDGGEGGEEFGDVDVLSAAEEKFAVNQLTGGQRPVGGDVEF